jgi:hypothetical protein
MDWNVGTIAFSANWTPNMPLLTELGQRLGVIGC